MAPQSFTDAAALSAALLTLRPRARVNEGGRSSAEVPGLGTITWLYNGGARPELLGGRMEAVGIELAAPLEPGQEFNRQAFVALLPEEMVPLNVSEAGQRIAFTFSVRAGHFRCRECRWGDGTNARGTHPGLCTMCAAKRPPTGARPLTVTDTP